MAGNSDTSPPAPASWTGRGGRTYTQDPGATIRQGSSVQVLAAIAHGEPEGRSVVPAGTRVAVRLLTGTSEAELRRFRQHARVLSSISKSSERPPCPRVLDRVGPDLHPGLVLEWCPRDLDQWWRETCTTDQDFATLCDALAALSRQLDSIHGAQRERGGTITPRIEPSAILQGDDGRWVFSAFRGDTPDDSEPTDFDSPEHLFGGRVQSPEARDTWSIGCLLLAGLRLRRLAREGMPKDGLYSHHLRSHRQALVIELHSAKPGLFQERALDPRQFLHPTQLPEPDRRAVQVSLQGVFGPSRPSEEARLAQAVLKLLDKALAIAPDTRFNDAEALAQALDQLSEQYRSLATFGTPQVPTDQAPGLSESATQIMSADQLRHLSHSSLDSAQPVASPKAVPQPSPPPGPDASADDVADRVASIEQDLARAQATIQALQRRPQRPRAPLWVSVAIFLLLMGQAALTGGVLWLAWGTVSDAPPAVHRAPTPARIDEPPPPAPSVPPEPAAPPQVEEMAPPPDEPVPPPAPVEAAPPAPPKVSHHHRTVAPAPPPVEPQEEATPEAPQTGNVSVSGGTGYLVGEQGRVSFGEVPVGSYHVYASPDDSPPQDLGTVNITPGATLHIRCGFGDCRVQ